MPVLLRFTVTRRWPRGGQVPMIPRVFSRVARAGRSSVPWVSTLACGAISLVLCQLDFSALVAYVRARERVEGLHLWLCANVWKSSRWGA
jgi:hypothetical protein